MLFCSSFFIFFEHAARRKKYWGIDLRPAFGMESFFSPSLVLLPSDSTSHFVSSSFSQSSQEPCSKPFLQSVPKLFEKTGTTLFVFLICMGERKVKRPFSFFYFGMTSLIIVIIINVVCFPAETVWGNKLGAKVRRPVSISFPVALHYVHHVVLSPTGQYGLFIYAVSTWRRLFLRTMLYRPFIIYMSRRKGGLGAFINWPPSSLPNDPTRTERADGQSRYTLCRLHAPGADVRG